MRERIKISVVVPIYNVERYLERCVDSIVNQTYHNLEIILVDDGSTDRSGEICDQYASVDNRIIVIHKANGGIVSARKAGIIRATGEYATNVDPDDWIEKNAYEMAIEIAYKYNPSVISFGMIKDYESFTEKYPNRMEMGLYTRDFFWNQFMKIVDENLFFTQPMDMSQCNKLIKTELFRKHELSCSESLKKNVDDAVIFPMLLDMDNIYIDERSWYHYCVRKNSILWNVDNKDYERFVKLSNRLMEMKKKYGEDIDGLARFLMYKMIHHLMLDVPEVFFTENECKIYPDLKKESKFVVYAKGVFANRLIARMETLDFGEIVANIDSSDVYRLSAIEEYDYIVVAVFNSRIVRSILDTLEENRIPREKILVIDKERISKKMFPSDLQNIL